MQFDFFEDFDVAFIVFKNMILDPSLYSNPTLRVAYIDEVEEREGGKVQKVYYSVLAKGVDNLDQVITLQTEQNHCFDLQFQH